MCVPASVEVAAVVAVLWCVRSRAWWPGHRVEWSRLGVGRVVSRPGAHRGDMLPCVLVEAAGLRAGEETQVSQGTLVVRIAGTIGDPRGVLAEAARAHGFEPRLVPTWATTAGPSIVVLTYATASFAQACASFATDVYAIWLRAALRAGGLGDAVAGGLQLTLECGATEQAVMQARSLADLDAAVGALAALNALLIGRAGPTPRLTYADHIWWVQRIGDALLYCYDEVANALVPVEGEAALARIVGSLFA